jgi:GTPase SAR1 family protein
MNNSQAPQILLVGLPGTGKTSFLAALWHYLKSTKISNKKLTQYQLSPNAAYLQKIHNDWLSFKRPVRTVLAEQKDKDIELFLEDKGTGAKFVMNVPDVAGETFRDQWETRAWMKTYIEEVKKAAGFIFFIHSQEITTLNLLQDSYGVPSEQVNSESSIQWSPKDTAAQVVLIELLQFHMEYFTRTPMPVVFVLSAWEKELDEAFAVEPTVWLETQMPMLSQFLKAHHERLLIAIYGISAQGGDFEDDDERAALQELREPAERIRVQVGTEKSKDISAPIQWLLETWQNSPVQ